MGMSGSSQRTTQNTTQNSNTSGTSTPTLPGWAQGGVQNYFGQVLSQMGQGGNGLQQQAWNGASNLTGNSGIQGGIDATQGLLGYNPSGVRFNGKAFDASRDLEKYMNPFTQNVIDNSLSDLQRFGDQQITANQGAATQSGAYGGSRHGVADALTNSELQRNAGSLSSGLNMANFGQAQGARQAEVDRELSAAIFNRNLGMQGAQFRGNMANQLGLLGMGADANSRANIGVQSSVGDDQRYGELMRISQLLGLNMGDLMGNAYTQNSNGTSTGTTSTSSNPGLLGGLGSLLTGIGGMGWQPFGKG